MNINNENLIYGKNSIIEAYNSKKTIKKLIVLKGLKDEKINAIIDALRSSGTAIDFKERNYFDNEKLPKANQGIVAEIEEFTYVDVVDIIDYAKEKNEPPFVLVLDEIEDPYNFGAIIRTAECMGCHGIIIKNRHQAMVTGVVVSASAGATNYMRIAKVNNIKNAIEELKKLGLWVACADMDGESIYNANLKGPICLVVGAEGNGVSRLVKENCDFVVKIPMKGHIDSFNVSVATGIILAEIYKQRIS